MAQITIEVPDALVAQLSSMRDRLPEVLARGLSEPSALLNEAYRFSHLFVREAARYLNPRHCLTMPIARS